MAEVATPNDYFSLCQLDNAQYSSRCEAIALSVAPVDKQHPIHALLKQQPQLCNIKENILYSVVFDQTTFFPLGGGQNADLGLVCVDDTTAFPVIGVFRIENIITHTIAVPKAVKDVDTILLNKKTTLRVDMARRLYNMHNHTTQHLLSAIFNQLFNLPTFGWTCGTYNPKLFDPTAHNATAPPTYDELQGAFSVIDFSGDIDFNLFNTLKFLAKAVTAPITVDIFIHKVYTMLHALPIVSVAELEKVLYKNKSFANLDEYLLEVTQVESDNILVEKLDLLQNDRGVSFQQLCNVVEMVANFIMNFSTDAVRVQIDGVIGGEGDDIVAELDPEQSTTSKGVTTTTITEDNNVLRENKKKYAKYGLNGAVPKRYINIGIEVSPCCGTHVHSLNSLQSCQIISTQKYGANRWRLTFVTHHTSLLLKNWYTALNDQLKAKLSCQSHEIIKFVEKNLNVANSLRFYNKKIYELLIKDILSIYTTSSQALQQPQSVIHYNDTFFTTNADLEQIAWGYSQQFKAKFPHAPVQPILFLTTSEVVAPQEGAEIDPTSTALFYVYGSASDKAELEFVKKFGTEFSTKMKSKGGGRPGCYQGKLTNAQNADCIQLFVNTLKELKATGVVSNVE